MSFKFDFQIEGTLTQDKDKLISKKSNDKPVKDFSNVELHGTCPIINSVVDSGLYDIEAVVTNKLTTLYGLTIYTLDETNKTKDNTLDSFLDVIPNEYEGGATIWECTKDLLNYLANERDILKNKTVLDLGCGLGLLGVFALIYGEASTVDFQDYNTNVILTNTIPTLLYNWMVKQKDNETICEESSDKFAADWTTFCSKFSNDFPSELTNSVRCFIGDWQAITDSEHSVKYNVILSSETIYNCDCYLSLHSFLENFLSHTGVAYFATKGHYFGVGGGLTAWTNFVNSKKVFKIEIVHTITDCNLLRHIITMEYI